MTEEEYIEAFDIIPETAPEALLIKAGKSLLKERDELRKRLDVYEEGKPTAGQFDLCEITVGGGLAAMVVHAYISRIAAIKREVG